MSTISEGNLPGVGRKFQVETARGDRLVIIIHDEGTREIYHYERRHFEKPVSVITLADSEARQIAGILGGLTYVPKALPSTELVLEDLVLEWFTLEKHFACVGKTIRELLVRTKTGASIVSIIEPNRQKHTNPEADTILNREATLIIAGDRQTNAQLKKLLIFGSIDTR